MIKMRNAKLSNTKQILKQLFYVTQAECSTS